MNNVISNIQIHAIPDILSLRFFGDETYTVEKKPYWQMILSTTGKMEITVDGREYTLDKNTYITVKPNSDVFIVALTVSRCYVFSLDCYDSKLGFFSRNVFGINGEQYSIVEKIVFEINTGLKESLLDNKKANLQMNYNELTMMLSCRLMEQFFIENKRKYYIENNIKSGYIVPEVKNKWERKNAYSRHYKEVPDRFFEHRSHDSYERRYKVSEDQKAEEIMKYVTENIANNVTLDSLVNVFHFSKTYICRMFKNKYSKTIVEYMRDLKMKEAKKLLLEGNLNVTQISESLGFSTVHYFSLTFKRYYGLSPSEYAIRNASMKY